MLEETYKLLNNAFGAVLWFTVTPWEGDKMEQDWDGYFGTLSLSKDVLRVLYIYTVYSLTGSTVTNYSSTINLPFLLEG